MARSSILRDLIARIVLKPDKDAAKHAEQEVSGTFDRIGATVKKVGAAIASAFAVNALIRFAQVAVSAAVEADREWNRLSGTLASVNVEFEKVEQQIRAGARAMKEAAGIGDDDYAVTLSRLVSLTGDFNLAHSQMGLVADVAARFFGGELAPAVDLVGRALNGQLRSLREVGIVTKDVNEGLRILRERSAGAAANELKSIDGRMKQLKDSAHEAREEIGFLILRLFGGSDTEIAINRFRLGLDGIIERLSRIGRRRAVLQGMISEELDRDLAMSDPTAGIATLDPLFVVGKQRTPEQINAEREERQRIRNAIEARAMRERNRQAGIADQSGIGRLRGAGEMRGLLEFLEIPESESGQQFREEWAQMWNDIGSSAGHAFNGIAGAFQDTFELLLSGAATIGSTFEELGRGIAAALIGGIAEYASIESGKEVAAGIGKLAAGTWPPNAAAIAAAGLHFKSAGLWAALAGLAGAAQSALGGGGRGGRSGGVPSGASDIGGRLAERTGPRSQTIIYIDGFNPKNGEHVRILGQGMRELAATDSGIEIRSRSSA